MKNFTNLINSLISEKRKKSASKLLENACGCAAVCNEIRRDTGYEAIYQYC